MVRAGLSVGGSWNRRPSDEGSSGAIRRDVRAEGVGRRGLSAIFAASARIAVRSSVASSTGTFDLLAYASVSSRCWKSEGRCLDDAIAGRLVEAKTPRGAGERCTVLRLPKR
jgi:hypothetical protein